MSVENIDQKWIDENFNLLSEYANFKIKGLYTWQKFSINFNKSVGENLSDIACIEVKASTFSKSGEMGTIYSLILGDCLLTTMEHESHLRDFIKWSRNRKIELIDIDVVI